MTVEEASQVETIMATQLFRTRQIFLTVNMFRSDHELWPLLVLVGRICFVRRGQTNCFLYKHCEFLQIIRCE